MPACRYNPDLAAKYKSLTAAGKPAKLAITCFMRKLIDRANSRIKAGRE